MIDSIKLWNSLLNSSRTPVGIKFLFTQEEYNKCKTPEISHGIPYCTAVMKSTNGHYCKMPYHKCRCIGASCALGFSNPSAESASGARHANLGVYKDISVSRSVQVDMVYSSKSSVGVEIKPLRMYKDYTPDIVIVIAPPKDAMRIVQGYAYHFGQLKNIKMAGMCAICQECTSYPLETDSMNISLLCSGTRCVGKWKEDELGIGFPYHYFKDILDGILNTVNPMESNESKKEIIENLDNNELATNVAIEFNNNYYKGAYKAPDKVE